MSLYFSALALFIALSKVLSLFNPSTILVTIALFFESSKILLYILSFVSLEIFSLLYKLYK